MLETVLFQVTIFSKNGVVMKDRVKIRHTVYANFQVYSPAFRSIAPFYMWHTGIHVLMVQILS